MQSNYYEVLGVSRYAEEIVIRAAYRALAQRYHPDKSQLPKGGEATAKWQAIHEAYHVLTDPTQRVAYDASLDHHGSEGFIVHFRTPYSIANLETRAWDILLQLHPQFAYQSSFEDSRDHQLTQTYRGLLFEWVFEKLVDHLVQSVNNETNVVSYSPKRIASQPVHRTH